MTSMKDAAYAYAASSARRGLRAQEADVFRRVNGALHAAREGGALTRARALADNGRLWLMVDGLMRDPANNLPEPLRASIISVGIAVRREMQSDAPDFGFLLGVNENIAAGLGAGDGA